ncbi:DUF7854 family protein [Halopenitus persicus]|uniref:Uncharacterized protein n=1 Tax=Halopenitus persicus TaxID=1048396 RepID=A0A1H3FU55_9EURY|nr:hypothetical protein [Halopenitus persicus]SDX93669.1 hypothetical protein SAMN05216564_102184 [Halopenitus persicus]
MDRISAIRNVEDALRRFEDGEASLAETERRTVAVLRTYATEFEGTDAVYRARGPGPVDGTVVVAPSTAAARERVRELAERDEADPSEASDENGDAAVLETDDGEADARSPSFEIERL